MCKTVFDIENMKNSHRTDKFDYKYGIAFFGDPVVAFKYPGICRFT